MIEPKTTHQIRTDRWVAPLDLVESSLMPPCRRLPGGRPARRSHDEPKAANLSGPRAEDDFWFIRGVQFADRQGPRRTDSSNRGCWSNGPAWAIGGFTRVRYHRTSDVPWNADQTRGTKVKGRWRTPSRSLVTPLGFCTRKQGRESPPLALISTGRSPKVFPSSDPEPGHHERRFIGIG
jgi:hypothetical protein